MCVCVSTCPTHLQTRKHTYTHTHIHTTTHTPPKHTHIHTHAPLKHTHSHNHLCTTQANIHTTTHAPLKHRHSYNHPCTTQAHIHICTTQTHAFTTQTQNHPRSTQAHIHTCTNQTHAFTTKHRTSHAPPKHTLAHIHTTTHLSECQLHSHTFTQPPIYQSVNFNVNRVQFSTNMAQKLVAYLILAKQHLGGQQRGSPFNFIHDRFGLHLHLQQSRGSKRRARATKLHPPQLLGIVQELCESRGGRPGLSVLTSLLVSVDVKIY